MKTLSPAEQQRLITKSGSTGKRALERPKDVQSAGVPTGKIKQEMKEELHVITKSINKIINHTHASTKVNVSHNQSNK